MHANHLLAHGLKAAKEGPPVKPGKSAFVAFLSGFILGPVGTGIYLESFGDFFVPLMIVIGASVLTGGLAAPIAWMFCGLYGAMRVSGSDDNTVTPT